MAVKEFPPVVLRHRNCGEITDPRFVCDHCGEEIRAREIEPLPGPGARADTAVHQSAKR